MSIFVKGHVPWIFSTVDNVFCNQQLGAYSLSPTTTFFSSDGITTHKSNSFVPASMSYSNQTSGLLFNTFSSNFPECKTRENMGVAAVDAGGNVYLQAPKFYNWLNVYDYKPYVTIFNPFSTWPEFTGKKWLKVLLGPGVLVGLTTTGELWTIANDVFSRYSGGRYGEYNGKVLSGTGGRTKAIFDKLDGTSPFVTYKSFDNIVNLLQTYSNTVDFYRPQKIDIFNTTQGDGEITYGSRLEGPAYLASILNGLAGGGAPCDSNVAAGSWLYNHRETYAKIAQSFGYRYVSAHDNRDSSGNTNYINPWNNFHRYWNGSSYQCMPASGREWLTSITLKGKITDNWKDIYITVGKNPRQNVTIFAISRFDEVYAWGYNSNFLISTQHSEATKFDTPMKVYPQPQFGVRDIDAFNIGDFYTTYGIDKYNRVQFLGKYTDFPSYLGVTAGIKKIVSFTKAYPYGSIYGIILGQDNKLYKINTSKPNTLDPKDIINSTLISSDTWLDISIGDELFPKTYANLYDKPNMIDAIRSDGLLFHISVDRDYKISITMGNDQFSTTDSAGKSTKFLKVATDFSFGDDGSINSTYTQPYGLKTIPSIVLASSRIIPPTPTPTNTRTPSNTPPPTLTPSITLTPTRTVTPTISNSATRTPTPTVSNSQTPSQSQTPSNSPTSTPPVTPSRTPPPTVTPSNTLTPSQTRTPSNSPTGTPPVTPTRTPSQTPTSSETPTVTPTYSKTPSQTPTESPTVTPTKTPTVSNSATPTRTPTISNSQTPTTTPTSSITPTISNSQTPTPTISKSATPTPTISNSATPTQTPTISNSATPTVSQSSTPTPTVSNSETPTRTPTPTLTPFLSETPTPTITPTISNSQTQTPTISNSQTPTQTPTVSNSATPTNTETPTQTPTTTQTPTNTITNTVTRTGTVTPTTTPTTTPTNTVTSSATPTQTITKTPTGTIPTGEHLYFWGKNVNTDKTGNTYKLIPDARSLVQYAQQPKIESLLENLVFTKVLALSIGENLSLSFGISSQGYLYGWGGSDDPDTDIYTENMYPKLIRALANQPIIDINYGQVGSSNNYVLYVLIKTAPTTNTLYQLLIGNNSASLGKEATIDAMSLASMSLIATLTDSLVTRSIYCLINKNNKYLREVISNVPTSIGTAPINSIGFGQNHSMAITNNGHLWARGLNEGRFGDNNSITSSINFVRVGVDDNWSKLVVGHNHTLAIKRDGSLWAWGFNSQGQLGCNDYTSRYIPTNISGDWREIYIFDGNIGQNISYGIQGDGSVWYWGAGIGNSPRLLDNSYNYESFSFSARSFDPTPTPTSSVTPSNTPTNTQTGTATPTRTPSETPTNTPTSSETPTVTPTNTPTNSETPTNTPTNSVTPSNTPTVSNSQTTTPTNSPTASQTPTNTVTPGLTATSTETPTPTPSQTPTNSETPTNTVTPSNTPTNSETPTTTPTQTPTNSKTPTNTPTNTKTPTYTPTQTITPSNTRTPTPSPRVIEKLILSQITRSAVLGVSNLQSFAQSFVAPQSGRLSKIEVEFVGSYTGQGILEVYESTIDSVLTKDPLYSATVSVNANNNFNLTAWVIPSGIDIFLAQGVSYTFKFIPISDMPEIYGLVISTKDKYNGGLFCSFDETNTVAISKLNSGANVSLDINPTTDFAYITNLVFNNISSNSYSIVKSISSENMMKYIGLETNGLEEKRAINSYDIYTTDNIIKTPIAVTITVNETITEEDFNKLRIGYVNDFGLLYDITASRNYADKTIIGHMPETGKVVILPISDGITPTPTVSSSSTPTGTPTQTPSATPTYTPTNTVTPGLTATATETPSGTPVQTPTVSLSSTSSDTETPAVTPSNTPT